jgi:hypothetical protein
MTGSDALDAVLSRVAASYDGAAFFSLDELNDWPKAAVATFKKAGLLTQAAPASSTACVGCERRCHMPVEIVRRASRTEAFVLCDKRDDINRVDVPLNRLEQWQGSGEAVAAFLASVLGLPRQTKAARQAKRWDVGRLRSKRTESVVLTIVDVLILELAGHLVRLDEVLSWKAGRIALDRQTLNVYVDNPEPRRAGRRDLAMRVAELDADIEAKRAAGVIAPVATALKAAGISRQRLHAMKKALKKRKASTLT